jgi:hypothetical protein
VNRADVRLRGADALAPSAARSGTRRGAAESSVAAAVVIHEQAWSRRTVLRGLRIDETDGVKLSESVARHGRRRTSYAKRSSTRSAFEHVHAEHILVVLDPGRPPGSSPCGCR